MSGGQRVDWCSDPWTLGSYSYNPVGLEDERAQLGEGIDTSLYFAGEAVAANAWSYGTVHGAIESGRASAWKAILSTK